MYNNVQIKCLEEKLQNEKVVVPSIEFPFWWRSIMHFLQR